jgi:uncharacterized protein with PQ loop repeat
MVLSRTHQVALLGLTHHCIHLLAFRPQKHKCDNTEPLSYCVFMSQTVALIMLSMFAILGRLAANLTSHQINQVESFVECSKSFLNDKVSSFIKDAHDEPVLVQRQGDGTWVKTQEKHTHSNQSTSVPTELVGMVRTSSYKELLIKKR